MKKGFTLIEIMLVVTILAIVSSIVLPAFYDLISTQSLKKDFSSVVSLAERARSMAINSKANTSFGVHFASTSATLFNGMVFSTSSAMETYKLNSRANISSISLGGGADIWFDKVTGYANASGTIIVSLKKRPTNQKTMTFFQTGVIQY